MPSDGGRGVGINVQIARHRGRECSDTTSRGGGRGCGGMEGRRKCERGGEDAEEGRTQAAPKLEDMRERLCRQTAVWFVFSAVGRWSRRFVSL